ncbi:MAG: hypothetical protein MUO23_06100, partial [Anaerolineales bacterium]|nr:hypothetical protein [Anaerolineales bacterium]
QEAGNSVAATEHMRVALALGGNDPTVVDAAGRLARLQGNEALATERIAKAHSLLREPNSSGIYYGRAYLRYYLASDLVPQLARADLTAALRDDLALLRDQLLARGQLEEALRVQATLDSQARSLEDDPGG